MVTYKNIRVKKRGGGSRLQRVKVLASGKYKFVKNLKAKKSKSSNPRSSRKKARKVKRKVAKKKRRRSSGMTIPLAPVAGLMAGIAGGQSPGYSPLNLVMAGDFENAANALSMNYTGYSLMDGSFDIKRLGVGVLPLVIGALVHKFVGGRPLNINAMLARAKVPLLRI